jgi:hypothetical protein
MNAVTERRRDAQSAVVVFGFDQLCPDESMHAIEAINAVRLHFE